MARPGDIVECNCGSLQALPGNGRVPLHKPPGVSVQSRFAPNCRWSGVEAGHWSPVSLCPACEETSAVRNAPPGARHPFVCGACGTVGDLTEFIDASKLQNQAKAKEAPKPGRHRYQEEGRTRPPPKNPPRCPGCRGTRIASAGVGLFRCADCSRTGGIGEFANRVAAGVDVSGPDARSEVAYLPVTAAMKAAAERAQAAVRAAPPPKKLAPARSLRDELEASFEGKLSAGDFDDVCDVAEASSKHAITDLLKTARRDERGVPQLSPEIYRNIQAEYSRLSKKLSHWSEDARDLAYLIYFGTIERACWEGEVPFRREDVLANVG